MENNFSFIDKYISEREEKPNFVIIDNKGENDVYIEDNNIGKFLTDYCRLNDQLKLGDNVVKEKVISNPPIIIDFKLRFDINTDSEISDNDNANLIMYEDDFILEIIRFIQVIISNTLDISDENTELICILLESDIVVKEDKYDLYHFRLQFPYCKVSLDYQSKILIHELIPMLRKRKTINRLEITPIGDWSTIISIPLIMEQSIEIYKKSEDTIYESNYNSVLQYKSAYQQLSDEDISAPESIDQFPLSECFFPSMNMFVDNRIIPIETINEHSHEYWLPLFLSQYYYNKITKVKELDPKTPIKRRTRNNNNDENKELVRCKDFMNMISKNKWENDMYWNKIGQSLHHVDNGNKLGLETWIQYTEKFTKHTAKECTKLYGNFKENGRTIKTLAWFGKEDSPDTYNTWSKEYLSTFIEKSISCCDSDVAEAFYNCYWLKFAYVPGSLRSGKWYYFENHTWRESKEYLDILRTIGNDFIKKYEQLKIAIQGKMSNEPDESARKILDDQIKRVNSLIMTLKNIDKKSKLVKSLREFFEVKNFDRYIDSNPNLTGTPNGIIEVDNKGIIFRNGNPEDYVSCRTAVKYRNDFTWEHEDVKKVMKWFKQMFAVNDELLHFFLKYNSSFFRGKNNEKKFVVITGSGNNSKTVYTKTLGAVFGNEYCAVIPHSDLTGKGRNGGGPNPSIARLGKARIVIASETKHSSELQAHDIKAITGNNPIFARFCNQDGGEMNTQFKLMLECNDIPYMSEDGTAIKNRLLIVPFDSVWNENAPKTEEEQFKSRHFKMDDNFEQEAFHLAPALLWVFFQYYIHYIKEGLKDPPKNVTEATSKYWDERDIYKQFIFEKLEMVLDDNNDKDKSVSITYTELYREFKVWFGFTYQGAKPPDGAVFKTKMLERLGPQEKMRWVGIKVKQEDLTVNVNIAKKNISPKINIINKESLGY